MNIFPASGEFIHGCVELLDEVIDTLLHNNFRGAGSGRDEHRLTSFEPFGFQVTGIINQIRWFSGSG